MKNLLIYSVIWLGVIATTNLVCSLLKFEGDMTIYYIGAIVGMIYSSLCDMAEAFFQTE